ncbi:MAG TPA: GNAT family N-acetyltransferase [Pseudonocardiaceae bacterium]|jgi:ribosomal protein S18 acetylase RimI-like enzyme|nr:GNAT family N-acetyltransferase [Pseudonocardiaceae bacterium]
MTIGSARRLFLRPYAAADEAAVLGLVNAERLPGQPQTTSVMLGEALAGRSPVDGGWWAELDVPRTDVVTIPSGQVVGVVSYATRPSDEAGLILWLHCRDENRREEDRHGEHQAVAEALVAHVLAELEPRTVYAFEFASALTLGLEGLPVRHRPVTHKVLEVAGFSGRDLWRYIHRRLDAPVPRQVSPLAEVCSSVDPAGWRLIVRAADRTALGEAIVGRPIDGIGVLWWISIAPAAHRRGLGRVLLGQCFTHLAANGAREVIAYVDDNASPGDTERDRTAANHLYDQAGFAEIDRLHSFLRRP